jgi:hypothetical protein
MSIPRPYTRHSPNAPGHSTRREDPYYNDRLAELRKRSRTVCIDDDCVLSGNAAHAGPCEPCDCPLEHAVGECPGTLEHDRSPGNPTDTSLTKVSEPANFTKDDRPEAEPIAEYQAPEPPEESPEKA